MKKMIQEQPISTAPRDGTIIAVCNIENDFVPAFWDHKMDEPFWAEFDGDCMEIDFEPTGWISEDEFHLYNQGEAQIQWL